MSGLVGAVPAAGDSLALKVPMNGGSALGYALGYAPSPQRAIFSQQLGGGGACLVHRCSDSGSRP